MKKLLSAMTAMAVLVLFFALTSCEGPQGPAGINASGTCQNCHSDKAAEINLKFNQYELSKHNLGIIYEEEAGRVQCGGCHSGDGFAEAARLGVNDAVTNATAKISCKTCHNIHTNYDTTDFSFRIKSGFALRHTGALIDQKEGNTCAKCHQARAFTRTVPDTIKPSGTGSRYSRFGPHYGVVANVVTMNGPILDGFTETNPHANLPKGCVSCHMAKDSTNPAQGGHTFKMLQANLANVQGCDNACHNSAKIKSAVMSKKIAADIALYRRKLIDKGWLDTTQAVTEEGYIVLGEYFGTPDGKAVVFPNKTDVDVVLNYLFIAKDRSNGIHNPAYIKEIVARGLDYLK